MTIEIMINIMMRIFFTSFRSFFSFFFLGGGSSGGGGRCDFFSLLGLKISCFFFIDEISWILPWLSFLFNSCPFLSVNWPLVKKSFREWNQSSCVKIFQTKPFQRCSSRCRVKMHGSTASFSVIFN